MKDKIIRKIFSVVIVIIVIMLIFLSSNFIYEVAVKYNILDESAINSNEDTSATESDNIDENNKIEVNNVNDIKTILSKLYPIDSDSKYIKNISSIYNGIEAYINGEEVSILVRSEASQNFSGLIANSYFEGEKTIRANVTTKKKIKTLLVGYYQDDLSVEFMKDVPYVFFLMEDGSVEYIDIKILLKNGYLTNPATNVRTRGTIKELKDIVKLEQCKLANEEDGYSTAVAIDKDGKIHNLFEYIEWNKQ